jgi:hypothetical protein
MIFLFVAKLPRRQESRQQFPALLQFRCLHKLAGENFGVHISVLSCGDDFDYAAHKA